MLTYINKYNLWCRDAGERYHFTLIHESTAAQSTMGFSALISSVWPRRVDLPALCADAKTHGRFMLMNLRKGQAAAICIMHNARQWTARAIVKNASTRVLIIIIMRSAASYIVCVEIMSGRECLMLSHTHTRVINWLRGMWIKRNHSSAFLFRCEERDYCKCVG